ncbi:MAG: hypothetical protein H6741_00185 [Alphaproteobacteria bacterium]|nr:hypothetical protein [Alphaproteobacteria bacterium]MCB9791122.1 hypothetical protein [Alphaproteobacteria bacterium]
MALRDRDVIARLLQETDLLHAEGRAFERARLAGRALDAARADPALLTLQLQAAARRADALWRLGQADAALAHDTWLLDLSRRPHAWSTLREAGPSIILLQATLRWVSCARELPPIALEDLFGVLDAGEARLRETGRLAWRDSLDASRAALLLQLGRPEEALGPSTRALALRSRHPKSPGFPRSTLRHVHAEVLRALSRLDEAEALHRQVRDDPRAGASARRAALGGLSRVCLDRGDLPSALRFARRALTLAEGAGPSAVGDALAALVAALRATGALEEAHAAAERRLRLAEPLGDRPRYRAHRDALDVALDRRDHPRARALLDAIAPLAVTMNGSTRDRRFTEEVAARRARLATGAGSPRC